MIAGYDKIFLGDTGIVKVMLGSILVYERGGTPEPPPEPPVPSTPAPFKQNMKYVTVKSASGHDYLVGKYVPASPNVDSNGNPIYVKEGSTETLQISIESISSEYGSYDASVFSFKDTAGKGIKGDLPLDSESRLDPAQIFLRTMFNGQRWSDIKTDASCSVQLEFPPFEDIPQGKRLKTFRLLLFEPLATTTQFIYKFTRNQSGEWETSNIGMAFSRGGRLLWNIPGHEEKYAWVSNRQEMEGGPFYSTGGDGSFSEKDINARFPLKSEDGYIAEFKEAFGYEYE